MLYLGELCSKTNLTKCQNLIIYLFYFLDREGGKNITGFGFFLMDFVKFFSKIFGIFSLFFLDFFLKIVYVTSKVTMVTTEHQKRPYMGKTE